MNDHKRYDLPQTITYRNLRVRVDLTSMRKQHFKERGVGYLSDLPNGYGVST